MQVNQKVDKVFIPESPSRLRANDFNQMRDELQGAIEEGGLTPTADVVQLPDAIKAIALQQAKTYTDDQLANLRLIQIVDALPETGDSKYLYGVPQDEQDAQGQTIIVLYVWTADGWSAAGAMSTNIDPATLATKDDLALYVKKTGDTMSGRLENTYESTDARYPTFRAWGWIQSGGITRTNAYGFYTNRKCTDDENKANTAGFFVSSDGAAKFEHKRGDNGKAEMADAYLLFDATKIKYGASGTKGSTSITEYDVLTSKDIATADKLGGIKIGQNLLMTADGKLSAVVGGQGNAKNLPLFYHTWADHKFNDLSWLRADTFSWQSGDVYTAAYEELNAEFEAAGTTITETVNGTTVMFRRSPKGYKIVLNYEDSYWAQRTPAVEAIYNSTGTGWYYILDQTNKRFKLPRTKWGFTGLRTMAGDYVAPGLPNITGTTTDSGDGNNNTSRVTGAFYVKQTSIKSNKDDQARGLEIGFDASLSNPIYGNSDTVQPPATQMYLYFYVGNYTQTAIEQTAGLNAELFNGKLDTTAFSTQASTNAILPTGMDYVVESYSDANGNWYRKYKSGWLEQGGTLVAPNTQVTFLKPYQNADYTVTLGGYTEYTGNASIIFGRRKSIRSTTGFVAECGNATYMKEICWIAEGQGAN